MASHRLRLTSVLVVLILAATVALGQYRDDILNEKLGF